MAPTFAEANAFHRKKVGTRNTLCGLAQYAVERDRLTSNPDRVTCPACIEVQETNPA